MSLPPDDCHSSSARHSPDLQSPRLRAVLTHRRELLKVADQLGAHNLGLCGSVARGQDTDHSDIDFYVGSFDLDLDGSDLHARERADNLVKRFREILMPSPLTKALKEREPLTTR